MDKIEEIDWINLMLGHQPPQCRSIALVVGPFNDGGIVGRDIHFLDHIQ